MPIYEYRCEACGQSLERIQKFSDAPLTDCPACGEAALVKQVSAPSFRLKGGGWYETDFKTGNKKYGAGDDSASAGKTSADQAAGSKAGDASKNTGTAA